MRTGLVRVCYTGLGCVILYVVLYWLRLGMVTRKKIKWEEFYRLLCKELEIGVRRSMWVRNGNDPK